MSVADYPVLGPYIPIIDEWLEQDEREPRKQLHTINHIYDGIICFVMDTDIYFITGKDLNELRVGDIFTGFYDATLPMIMIYPRPSITLSPWRSTRRLTCTSLR